MLAPVLNESAGEAVGFARIGGRPPPHAFIHDRASSLVRRLGPDERLGEVDRRRDENEAFHAPGFSRVAQRADGEQRKVPPHRGAHQNLLSLALRPNERQRLLEPAGDGSVLEPPVRAAMAGIVEPEQAKTATLGLRVERGRLGRVHVGAITAEPNKAWTSVAHWRTTTEGDTPLIRGVSDDEDLRLSVRHTRLAYGDAACRPRLDERRHGRAERSGLG